MPYLNDDSYELPRAVKKYILKLYNRYVYLLMIFNIELNFDWFGDYSINYKFFIFPGVCSEFRVESLTIINLSIIEK